MDSPAIVEPPAFGAAALLRSAMKTIDRHMGPLPPSHGNTILHERSVVGLLLCAAFEPSVRTLRALDDLSLHPRVAKLTGVPRAPLFRSGWAVSSPNPFVR